MKILYIHQYFNTPIMGGPTRSYWVSKALMADGHDVTMLTSNNYIEGPKRRIIEGINLINLKISYKNEMGILRRLQSFVQFMLGSAMVVLHDKKYDLIIATSTPLTIGFPALVGKKWRKIPYIFEVRDLWPEVPIQMGALRGKFLIRFAKWFELSIYKNASHIIALSPGMLDGVLSTGISIKKISVIPNMSKIDVFWPRKKDSSIFNDLSINPDTFKVVYFGSMGLANGMDYILDAAKILDEESEISFIFIGGGAMKKLLIKRCNDEGIRNAHFIDGLPHDELSAMVNNCNLALVTFANIPILATNSPNKFFDSLSAGKAIIVNSPGWTKDLVEDYGCGLYVDPKNPDDLAEKILYLYSNRSICDSMGKNARNLAETKFDKSILCKTFCEIVNNLGI